MKENLKDVLTTIEWVLSHDQKMRKDSRLALQKESNKLKRLLK